MVTTAIDGAPQRVIRTDDAKEGPLAFVEKRAPRWTTT